MELDSSIMVALITLAGVIISALITRNNLYSELDKKDAVMEQRLDDIDEHLREHNHYSKLFNENIPVINEQIKELKQDIQELKHAA